MESFAALVNDSEYEVEIIAIQCDGSALTLEARYHSTPIGVELESSSRKSTAVFFKYSFVAGDIRVAHGSATRFKEILDSILIADHHFPTYP